jgi:hypothetical protein
LFDSVRHFIGETQFKTSAIHLVLLTFRLSNSRFDSLFDRPPSKKTLFNQISTFSLKSIFASVVSLQQEVKDLAAKLNQVLGAVAKLTKQVNTPSVLQEAAGAQSAPGKSGDSIYTGMN